MKRLTIFFIALSSLFGGTKMEAQAAVAVSITVAPPVLPVYVQPACPVEGYMWTPGYWAWGVGGYYWVPGVWLRPARVGFLWTPGYWGFVNGAYFWHGGYWGPHVGFYGGVCYGYGYGGTGFCGGRWEGSVYRYNTAVCNVNSTVVHNTYVDKTVINNTGSRTSFNGTGGITRGPNETEQSAAKEDHAQPTSEQVSHQNTVVADKNQLSTANGGHPSATAMSNVGGQKFNSEGKAPVATKTAQTAKTSSSFQRNASRVATSHANANRQQSQHASTSHQNNMNRGQQHNASTGHQQRTNGGQQQRNSGGGRSQHNNLQRGGGQLGGGNRGTSGQGGGRRSGGGGGRKR